MLGGMEEICKNGVHGTRETSTLIAWISWIQLELSSVELIQRMKSSWQILNCWKHWMPVDLSMLVTLNMRAGHLMYSRIWNNYLYDKGIVPCKEPFQKLVHRCMIFR